MAKIYAELIKKGMKTIDDVPKALQEAVKALLEGDSIDWFYITMDF